AEIFIQRLCSAGRLMRPCFIYFEALGRDGVGLFGRVDRKDERVSVSCISHSNSARLASGSINFDSMLSQDVADQCFVSVGGGVDGNPDNEGCKDRPS